MFTISPISQSRFAREQLNRTHFARIDAHWIVGAFGRLLGLGLGRDLLLHLDELAALALGLLVGLLARLFAFFARLLGQQRAVRRGLGLPILRHLVLLRRHLGTACHESPQPAPSPRRGTLLNTSSAAESWWLRTQGERSAPRWLSSITHTARQARS